MSLFYAGETIDVDYTALRATTVGYQWLRDGVLIVIDNGPPDPHEGDYDEELTGAQAGGFVVPADEVWKITGAVTSDANVEVRGTLVMRGGDSLTFTGIDETTFVGAPTANSMNPEAMATDIGLWILYDGILDARGTTKTPWLFASAAVAQGATTVTLASVPTGWLAGDTLVLTPTVPPTTTAFYAAYDTMTIASIASNVVTFTGATTNPHPFVNALWGCEVLNLTRDCNINGQVTGRTHINFNHTTSPQAMANVGLRYVGPRKALTAGKTTTILGRWGLHMHMTEDASRGTTFDNIVVRDCGSHSYTMHLAHGITLTGCISHDTIEDSYWWDQREEFGEQGPPSNDITYLRCVASKVEHSTMPTSEKSRLCGFNLLNGENGRIIDCVAVGVRGTGTASGILWPEGTGVLWTFEGGRTHNNAGCGIRAWQNPPGTHLLETFASYYNGYAGVDHGAYRNRYKYQDAILYGNVNRGITSHANALLNSLDGVYLQRLTFGPNLTFNGAGITEFGIELVEHRPLPPMGPVLITGCDFTGHTIASIGSTNNGEQGEIDWALIQDCNLEAGKEFWITSAQHTGSEIIWEDQNTNTRYYIHPPEEVTVGFTYNATWNAMVKSEAM